VVIEILLQQRKGRSRKVSLVHPVVSWV